MAETKVYAGPKVLAPHYVLNVFGNVATTGDQSYLIDTWKTTVVKDVRPVNLKSDTPMYIQRRVFNTSIVRSKGRVGPVSYVYYNDSDVVLTNETTEGNHNALKNRAWSNMGSGDLNVGNSLGEIGATASLIRDRVGSILDAVSAIRKKDIESAFKALSVNPSRRSTAAVKAALSKNHDKGKSTANAWLELKFGWLPLLQDIHGAVELVNTGLLTTGIEIHSGSGVKPADRSKLDSQQANLDKPTGFHVMPNGRRIPMRDAYKPFSGPLASHASIRATVKNPALANLQQLGLLNPLAIAWELMPLSFVIDWVLPVGTWLNNLTAGAGLSDIQGSTVTERRTTFGKSSGGWTEQQQNIWRTPIDGFGIPRLFDMVNLNLEKAFIALALAKQRS